jgi:hypothetical protein
VVFQQPKVLRISTSVKEVLGYYTSHSNLVNPYLSETIVFRILIKFLTNPSPLWYCYCVCNLMHTVNGNNEMQDFEGPKAPTPVKIAPIVMLILAMTMVGASSGIIIADRDALPFLKQNIASQLAGVRNYLLDTASAKPETPTVIQTGISSIVAIYYSSKPDSARVAFDLEKAELVRAEELRSPDRIYFDLQARSREQGASRRMKTQKAVSIAGNLLTRVRIAQRKPGATRIVLDLKRSCDFTYQTSPGPPSRLMVENRPRPTDSSASN